MTKKGTLEMRKCVLGAYGFWRNCYIVGHGWKENSGTHSPYPTHTNWCIRLVCSSAGWGSWTRWEDPLCPNTQEPMISLSVSIVTLITFRMKPFFLGWPCPLHSRWFSSLQVPSPQIQAPSPAPNPPTSVTAAIPPSLPRIFKRPWESNTSGILN